LAEVNSARQEILNLGAAGARVAPIANAFFKVHLFPVRLAALGAANHVLFQVAKTRTARGPFRPRAVRSHCLRI
jgi:hypothetical protein